MIKTISNITITIGFFAVLLFSAFLVITSNTEIIPGIRSFVVLTGSMEPSLPVGSMVFTSHKESYAIGDIITFASANPDILITHRVVDIEDGRLITKGDANPSIDKEFVYKEDVVGKVENVVPYIGRISNAFSQPHIFLLALVIPTLLFVGRELWVIKNEIVRNTERRVRKSLRLEHEYFMAFGFKQEI